MLCDIKCDILLCDLQYNVCPSHVVQFQIKVVTAQMKYLGAANLKWWHVYVILAESEYYSRKPATPTIPDSPTATEEMSLLAAYYIRKVELALDLHQEYE